MLMLMSAVETGHLATFRRYEKTVLSLLGGLRHPPFSQERQDPNMYPVYGVAVSDSSPRGQDPSYYHVGVATTGVATPGCNRGVATVSLQLAFEKASILRFNIFSYVPTLKSRST